MNAQGSRLYYAADATAWTALAPGAYPASPWVEVTRGTDIDVVPHETEEVDDSCLNDTAPDPNLVFKPGSVTFSREKDANSGTLRALVGVKKAWAAVHVDGTAEYVSSGYLVCTSAGKASKGFANKVTESYKIVGRVQSSLQAHT